MHQVTCLNRSSIIFFPEGKTHPPLKNCDVFTPTESFVGERFPNVFLRFFPGKRNKTSTKRGDFWSCNFDYWQESQAPDEDEDFLGWVGWKPTEFGFGGVYAPPPKKLTTREPKVMKVEAESPL